MKLEETVFTLLMGVNQWSLGSSAPLSLSLCLGVYKRSMDLSIYRLHYFLYHTTLYILFLSLFLRFHIQNKSFYTLTSLFFTPYNTLYILYFSLFSWSHILIFLFFFSFHLISSGVKNYSGPMKSFFEEEYLNFCGIVNAIIHTNYHPIWDDF